MAKIEWNREQRGVLVERLREYLLDELDVELGQFDADALLDFLDRELGPAYYNLGLLDARAVLADRVGSLSEAIEDLEQATDLVR